MMKQVSAGVLLIVLVSLVAGSEDKYSVKVQGGLAFSEFRGYEDWQAVGVSRSESALAVILGNPAMIEPIAPGFQPTVRLYRTEPGWLKSMGAETERLIFSPGPLCRGACRTSISWSRTASGLPTAVGGDTAHLITTRHPTLSGQRTQPAGLRRGTTPGVGSRVTRRLRQATTFSRATARGDGSIRPIRVKSGRVLYVSSIIPVRITGFLTGMRDLT